MPLAALTPVLNDLLHKEGGNSSPFPQRQSQQQLINSNESPNDGNYLSRPSLGSNQNSSSSAINDTPRRHYSMTPFKLNKSLKREDSFLRKFSNRYSYRGLGSMKKRNLRLKVDKEEPIKSRYEFISRILRRCNYFVVSTDESFLFYWLILLSICVLYNLWFSIARQAFDPLQYNYARIWEIIDYIADLIYFLDILIQFRTGYLEQGLLVYNHYKLAMNYIRSSRFIFDILSLTPLDLLQIKFGPIPILRFPRFFKIYRTFQLYYLQESRTVYPNTYRVLNLFHILLLLGHWLASFYFMVSKAEGFVGYWSYPKPVGNFSQLAKMYLRCLYWSTLTLTTIGDLPPPETNWQTAFAIASYMIGIFVYSSIIGQVGNVITNRNASRLEFEHRLDSAKQYMRSHNVPAEMQRRVQRWYNYSWSRGQMSGAGDVHSIKLLPDKLKTELALHVNLGTLKKVTIFQECQPEFLHDLVLKMRAYIFTPGDIICRKGEVAREMFIIADGVLEVVNDQDDVLTRLVAGDFFGEIGILNIDGANRRTADVRSVGYSELFSLSKEDVLEGCRDYPEAERKLYEYAHNRLDFDRAKNEVADNMTDAFNALTSTASCLKHHPAVVVPTSPDLLFVPTKADRDFVNDNSDNDGEVEKGPSGCSDEGISSIDTARLKSKILKPNSQNCGCKHQHILEFCQNSSSKQISSFRSSDCTYSNDLISEIDLLISDNMRSIEQFYRQEIAGLQEQNENKDLRIKLLEQKLQKLQVKYFSIEIEKDLKINEEFHIWKYLNKSSQLGNFYHTVAFIQYVCITYNQLIRSYENSSFY
ncbi:unnamed protein product [Rotaria magnacalcarata]|uniref:Cyclic nucleotide-binding domain-containing protein n=1 Tax=Rotaria magnacalcarata TaxID=392030 RepID=A0A819LV54_9BILA|nr:unnamed protein product [Rotaria magnacalcarata]